MGYMTDGLTFNVLRGGNRARLPLFDALLEAAFNRITDREVG